jgi:hypothetical protein
MSTVLIRVNAGEKIASNFRVYFRSVPLQSCLETLGSYRNRPSFLEVPARSG